PPAIRSAGVASAYSRGRDVGAQGAELAGKVLVAAPDVVGVEDQRLAVGAESGHQEGGASADVRRPHRRAREAGPAPDDGVMSFGADVGTHAHELVDVAEASGEEVLG